MEKGMITNELIHQPISDTLEKNYLPYVMSVILSRALPEIDGFKPSHRKILYTMYKMGLLKGLRTKSANVVGQTMKLNPHGDEAIYGTLVRLSKDNESLLYPYVDSKGNFGKVYSRDMSYAASRYTEVKLMPIAEEIFTDVDKDTVDFVPNYDGTMYEPSLLPVKFPTILTNPTKGIAVGMASNICSFNLGEIIDATIALTKHPRTNLLRYITGPDFPTGGLILRDEAVFRQMMEEGTGTFRIRGKSSYSKKDNIIEITEIPYTTTNEAIIDKTIQLIKDGLIKEISDIRDETGLAGPKIAIDLKRGADPDKVLHRLYRDTTLEDTFSCNFNIVLNGYPAQLGVRGILQNWLDFRIGCFRRKVRYDLRKYEDKLHLIQGLKKVLLDIDRVIKLIRETKRERDVIPRLMEAFSLDEIQAEFVANIRLRNINREYIQNRVDEEQELIELVDYWRSVYNSDQLILDLIVKELREIKKKYDKGRRSELIEPSHVEIVEEIKVEVIEELIAFRTWENYLKLITPASLERHPEQRLKAEDEIVQELAIDSSFDLLFFSDQGNVYKSKANAIEQSRANELGQYLPTILELEPKEEIVHMVATKDYSGYMLFLYENGKLAKIPLESYITKTNRRQLINAYYTDEALVQMAYIPEDQDILIYRYAQQKEMLLLLDTAIIKEKVTRHSQGVQVVRMNRHASVTAMDVVDADMADKLKAHRVRTIPSSGTVRKPFDR
ncbi:MAG TPA: topoisomerase IV [Tissierellia bacterium]|nr:topoisomerase IV [Tissierellia bacterium]